MPLANELPTGWSYFNTEENRTYHTNGTEWELDDDITWMLDTDTFTIPSIVYTENNIEVETVGSLTPVVLAGTQPITEWAVIGTLPPEFTFDSDTGVISYDTTGSVASSGSFQVTADNPKGTSDPYDFDWEISSGNGISQYTNSDNIYPGFIATYTHRMPAISLV